MTFGVNRASERRRWTFAAAMILAAGMVASCGDDGEKPGVRVPVSDGYTVPKPLTSAPPVGAPRLDQLMHHMEEATVRAGGVAAPTKARCETDKKRIGTRPETFACTVSYRGKAAEFRASVSVLSKRLTSEPGQNFPSGTEYKYRLTAVATKLVLTREGVHRQWGYHPSGGDDNEYRCDAHIPEAAVAPPGPTPYRCYDLYRLGYKTRVAAFRVVLSAEDGEQPDGSLSFKPAPTEEPGRRDQ
ncbi:hypothetical protein BS35_006447 [Actinomadura glauciflava]|uniref:hypothetical protein n=1 Tax=Actinomadura luteofluorescens TaxID=46163 RepID=UPI0021640C25|nr:hypothetical protein [Actinomadura glauciflava]MCR3743866.1 hypothetical protein [Actinomadura glauciflava]